MITDDEYLERVVAAIQSATNDGADVKWNETINGRQFDVVMRFTLASLRYLVIFEVKNRRRKARAEDIDAFVTKSRDQQANKAVFVNVAGFQSGAVSVAERHGIEIFTVHFDESRPQLSSQMSGIVLEHPLAGDSKPEIHLSEPEPVLQVTDIKLQFADGKTYSMPEEASQLRYYMGKTQLDDGASLDTLMTPVGYIKIEDGEKIKEAIDIAPARKVMPPDDYYFPAGKLAKIEFQVELTTARMLSGNVRIDPSAFRSPVVYTNARTGEAFEFRMEQLPIGDREVVPGKFYMQLHPLMYYHCDGIDDEVVTWSLIESFQNGHMSRATFTQKTQYAVHFIPIRDGVTIARLKRRLEDYSALQAKNRPTVT